MTEKENTQSTDKNVSTQNLTETNDMNAAKTDSELAVENIENDENIKTDNDEIIKQGHIKTIIDKSGLNKRPLSRQESLKEFLVMTDSGGEKVSLENEGLDSVISKQESELTDEERMLLYDKAMSFKGLGSNNHALLCFLGCLKGLQPSSKSKFTMLPQCLTHISEIYALAGDYQRAVEFMQGTKLYYETAIIEAGMQVDKYKEKSGEEYRPLDFDPCLDEAKRANEYERLASSCLEQKKFQLALEYCGKATKLRQTAYGDEHPLTVKSLDLFTLIYAEMGKSQYSEAMSKVGDIVKELREEQQKQKLNTEIETNSPPETDIGTNSIDAEENTNARNSKDDGLDETIKHQKDLGTKEEGVEKHVTFKEEPITDHNEKHVNNFTFCQVVLFIMLSAILAIMMTFTWCYISESTSCPSRGYFYNKLEMLYYYYLVPTGPDNNHS